jgi:hypothetical protein
MASFTYLMSIYVGLMIVGNLLFPTNWTGVVSSLNEVFEDPVTGIQNMLVEAFTGPDSRFFIISVAGTAAIVGITALTGGFLSLYIIPAILGMALLNFLAFPMQLLFSAGIPDELKWILILFMGALNVLTVWTYTAGRP